MNEVMTKMVEPARGVGIETDASDIKIPPWSCRSVRPEAAIEAAADLTGAWALVRGSARARTLVL